MPFQYDPALGGLVRAIPKTALMSPDDMTQLPLAAGSQPSEIDPELYSSIFASQLGREAAARGLDVSKLGAFLQDPLAGQAKEVEQQHAQQLAAIQQGFRGSMPQQVQGPTQDGSMAYTSAPSQDPTAQVAQASRLAELQKVLLPEQMRVAAQKATEEEITKRALATQAATAAAQKAEHERNIQDIQNVAAAHPEYRPTEITLPGGGGIRFETSQQAAGGIPKIPTGQAGQQVLNWINRYNVLKHPNFWQGLENRVLGTDTATELTQLEGKLDTTLGPAWRKRLTPQGTIDTSSFQTPTTSPIATADPGQQYRQQATALLKSKGVAMPTEEQIIAVATQLAQ